MANDLVLNERNKLQGYVMETERRLEARKSMEECHAAAELVLNSYPNANVADEVTYLRLLRELFLGYPAEVVEAIASPRTGIVTRCKFVPTIQEISEMAQPIIDRLHSSVKRDRLAIEQLRDRDEPSRESPEERAAHVEEALQRFDGSAAKRSGKAEYFWEEHERTPQWKARQELLARTQCQPGQAIAEHLKAERQAE